MQFIFECSLDDYLVKGKGREIVPPHPSICPNPACRVGRPPKKHGFYQRYTVKKDFTDLINIRRYYCPHCGMTFSYLPSFCLPYFQYVLHEIWEVLVSALSSRLSYEQVFKTLFHLSKQHISFYCKRFIHNLSWIQSGVRSMYPTISLPDGKWPEKEKAKKVLDSILDLSITPNLFSQRFFEECHQSFLAAHHFLPE